MEQRDHINYAKSELKNLRYLQRVVQGFNNKLAVIDNQLQGVSGTDISKEISSSNSATNRDSYLLDLLEKKQRIIKDRAPFVTRVERIVSFLDSLDRDNRKIVTDVYIKGFTIESTSIWLYCSEDTVKRRIDKILADF